jgi:hypothetical protein
MNSQVELQVTFVAPCLPQDGVLKMMLCCVYCVFVVCACVCACVCAARSFGRCRFAFVCVTLYSYRALGLWSAQLCPIPLSPDPCCLGVASQGNSHISERPDEAETDCSPRDVVSNDHRLNVDGGIACRQHTRIRRTHAAAGAKCRLWACFNWLRGGYCTNTTSCRPASRLALETAA